MERGMNDLPAHSIYSASGAHRWTACPGSVAATAALPEVPSSYAQEGTACHAVASLCLTEKQDAIEYVGRTVEGIEIDEDHAVAIQVYLDAIRDDQKLTKGKLLIEQKFHLKDVHPQFFGTADCVRWGTDDVLTVYDAKFGKGEIVEVKRPNGHPNIQLGFYALGALYHLMKVANAAALENLNKVQLVVVQPRAWHRDGPVRRATFPVEAIFKIETELLAAVRRCEKPNPALITGPHCRFCRAAGTCPALRDKALHEAQLAFSEDADMVLKGVPPSPASLTPEQLSHVLSAADLLDDWLSAVRAHADVVAEKGKIPGWKLIAKQARRKWAMEEDKVAFDLMYDFDLDEDMVYETKLKSPAQVEKLLKPADRASSAFKRMCPAVSSGLTLVRDSNPRLEVVPAQAAYDDGTSTPEDQEW
jgi:hypothetical protein